MICLLACVLPVWGCLGSTSMATDSVRLTPQSTALSLELLEVSHAPVRTETSPRAGNALVTSSADDQPTSPSSERTLVGLDPASPRCGLPYATQGSVAGWFEVGTGVNFDDGWMVLGGVGVEWYPVDGFALGFRVDGVGIELKDTPTTGGGGGALLLRWHVYRAATWSIYLDGGCGLVYFAEEVPSGASRLDFSPQVGGGVTCAIADNLRLMAGLRWYHLSNAQTNSTNPGVDMLQAYVGLTIGF
ncbi:MAG: acyloxyacyl hydrolase [Planctomycetota bacterium]|nr:acyloxyacyl hydrolase [Planctomycetota bacterium]